MISVRHYVITAVLIFLGKVAFAGVLIEPYVGYSLAGKLDIKETARTSKYDYSGLNLGGRLGYQYLGLMGGLAYDHGAYNLTNKNRTTDTESRWNANSYGAFVGFNFPILLRVWGTYFFTSDWTVPETKGGVTKDDKVDGSAYELGVGYTALPFISLNLQYRLSNFSKYGYGDGTPSVNLSNTKAKSVIVSVSLPISF